MKAACHLCYGRGIIRDRHTKRYERCPCGRLPDSWGARKLATQHALDARAESIRKGGAW